MQVQFLSQKTGYYSSTAKTFKYSRERERFQIWYIMELEFLAIVQGYPQRIRL